MKHEKRPIAFWSLCTFLALTLVLLLLGQTTAIFAYDFAVGIGMQESADEIGPECVAVNRAFGVGDTVVYIPLIVIAWIGLVRKRRWALGVTAAVMGISAYWAVTSLAGFLFLDDVAAYRFEPGLAHWVTLGAYTVIGAWGLFYVTLRGGRLARA